MDLSNDDISGPRAGERLGGHLGLAAVIGLSVSVIAPSMAVAFNATLAAGAAGDAVPLVFLLGAVIMVPIALAFAGFSRAISSAGSAMTFVGASLGARPGALAGWVLMLGYAGFAAGSCGLAGNFVDAAMAGLGYPPVSFGGVRLWFMLGMATMIGSTVLAYSNVDVATRLMLWLEGVSLLAVLALVVVIMVTCHPGARELAHGFVPGRASASASASASGGGGGGGWSGVGYAIVFAFLSFGGFEGAATLGEETANPRRDIPRAMIGTIATLGMIFVIITLAQVIGFAHIPGASLAAADAPLDVLATHYVAPWFAVALDLANAVSAFACTLGAVTAAARLAFALGRAGILPGLGRVHPVHGTPALAVIAVGTACLAAFCLFAPAVGAGRFYGYASTIGALGVMVVYGAVLAAFCVGGQAVRAALPGSGPARLAIGLAGAIGVCWPLYNTLYPVPAYPDRLWPYVVLGWIGLGAGLILHRFPRARRAPALEGTVS